MLKGTLVQNIYRNALIWLLLVLRTMTGAVWQCGVVAALFAHQPLHVESVTWVAERKDVLRTFFWMLTMWGCFWYAGRPGKVLGLYICHAAVSHE